MSKSTQGKPTVTNSSEVDDALVKRSAAIREPVRNFLLWGVCVGVAGCVGALIKTLDPQCDGRFSVFALFFVAGWCFGVAHAIPLILGLPPGKLGQYFPKWWTIACLGTYVLCVLLFQPVLAALLGATALILMLVIVAVSTMLVARSTFRILHELQPFTPSDTSPDRLLFSHVTDLHVTADKNVARLESGPGGQRRLGRWIEMAKDLKCTYLIISGDLTDTSSLDEWKQIREALKNVDLDLMPLIICPGNHDLSPAYNTLIRERFRDYLNFQSEFCPQLKSADGRALSAILQQADKDVAPKIPDKAKSIRAYSQMTFGRSLGLLNGVKLVAKEKSLNDDAILAEEAREQLLEEYLGDRWFELFPFTFEDQAQKTLIITLNSVSKHVWLGESAIGGYGESQLGRFKAILEGLSRRPCEKVVVVTHHALCRHSDDIKLFADWRRFKKRIWEFALLTFADPKETRIFFDILTNAANVYSSTKFIVVCGHQHRRTSGTIGSVIVLEGDSLSEAGGGMWLAAASSKSVEVFHRPVD